MISSLVEDHQHPIRQDGGPGCDTPAEAGGIQGMRRDLVTDRVVFRSGTVECVGHWYGSGAAVRRPCVVLCTGFAGTQDTPSIVATARAFAAAGYAALTFDFR